jgi:magnesium chelatase family protein
VQRYQGRLSGPLLDRIDLHVNVPALPKGIFALFKGGREEDSAQVKARVITARKTQMERGGKANAFMQNDEITKYCAISEKDGIFLEQAIQKFGLSARAYHRLLKVARTIADLGMQQNIELSHLTEALSYRSVRG